MRRFFSNPIIALVAGLGLRLYFVLVFPTNAGDTGLYEQLARNWVQHHIYGMDLNGVITPVDVRMPGYPGFLALIYELSGKIGAGARIWVMGAQVVVDLLTCIVIAGLAAALALAAFERARAARVFAVALWLTALCPFTANYVAVPLTETWATFFTALGILFLCLQVLGIQGSLAQIKSRYTGNFTKSEWFGGLAGLAVGFGTLFRPETPLLLIAASPVLGWIFLRKKQFIPGVRNFVFMGLGCFLPLLPWTVRNAVTLHEAQLLSPPNATLPGELVPYGFMAWEHTWLYRMRETYAVAWKLNDEAIQMDDIPARAFDTPEEKERGAAILEKYNDDMTWTPEEDAGFAQLAKERTARHPLRTYLTIPAARASMMWMTPRIELLPFSGKVFPLSEAWEEDPVDLSVTLGFAALNALYLILAAWGACKLWAHRAARPVVALLLAFIVLRTVFLATLETPEPRYTLVCFPAILALAAYVLAGKNHGQRAVAAEQPS